VSATAPLSLNASTGVISVGTASSVSAGVLSAADYLNFSGKQNALGYTPVNLAGDTMTGNLSMGGTAKVTNLAAPTSGSDAATKTYVDDGLALKVSTTSLGSLATLSTVTTAQITDGTITDGDISSSAAIADTKLATILTAGKVSGAAINSGTIGGSTSLNTTGSVSTSGNIVLTPASATPSEIRFVNGDGTRYVGFKSPSVLVANQVWTLPNADGPNGYVLSTNGAGTLSWTHKNEGSVTYIAAGSGLTGGPITSVGTIQIADTAVTPGTYSRATVTVNSQGRITAASSGAAISLPTDVAGILPVANGGLGVASAGANQVFAGPALTAGTPSFRALGPDDYPTMGGATASLAGTKGAVPAPSSGAEGKFLRGDGTWATPPALAMGSTGQLQFNSLGSLAGASGLNWDSSNQRFGIGTSLPSYTLHVQGAVAGEGSYIQLSDQRFKKNVQKIKQALSKVEALRGVTYQWIQTGTLNSGTNIGFLAQEIEKVIPEVVDTDGFGIKRVRYSELIPILVEAMKELHEELHQIGGTVRRQEAEISRLSHENAAIKLLLCEKFPDTQICPDGEEP
jgi:hypothetical protein